MLGSCALFALWSVYFHLCMQLYLVFVTSLVNSHTEYEKVSCVWGLDTKICFSGNCLTVTQLTIVLFDSYQRNRIFCETHSALTVSLLPRLTVLVNCLIVSLTHELDKCDNLWKHIILTLNIILILDYGKIELHYKSWTTMKNKKKKKRSDPCSCYLWSRKCQLVQESYMYKGTSWSSGWKNCPPSPSPFVILS